MVQVKKAHVRENLIQNAYALFRHKGYSQCSMADIATASGMSVANIYVYFPSKLDLFYEVYIPIIESRLIELDATARNIEDPYERLRCVFLTLWRDIPQEDNGFARSFMEAIVTAPMDVDKPHAPLKWCVDFVHELIMSSIPADRRFRFSDKTVSFVTWMAFDGFVINVGRGEDCDFEQLASQFATIILGENTR